MVERNFIDLGVDTPPASSAPPHVEDRRLRAVHELCNTWSRAVKTIGLYPASNPLPEEFRHKYYESLNKFLDDESSLVLTTFDGSFVCDGQTVYSAPEGEENLADIFFRDGIREITFETGVTREETDQFLAIIVEAFTAGAAERVDIANRLWEGNFPHIRHLTVDRVVEGAYIEAADDKQLAGRHRGFIGADRGPDIPAAVAAVGTVDAEIASPYSGIQRERHVHVVKVFGNVTGLTPEEKEEVATLCRPEPEEQAEALGLDILMEILRSTENARMIDDTVGVLQRQFGHCVGAGRWDLARTLLQRWHMAIAEAPALASQKMTAALPSLSDRRHFERLAEYLNATPQADLEPIRSMLTLFGSTAITPITAMLGSLEHRPARVMVCDYLVTHGRDTVDLIGGFIYDKRWFVARNVAMILGEIGHERGLSFLRKSAGHADPRVRLETLRALKRIDAPEAERIMQGFLKDPDGDLRKRALKALGQTGGAAALEELKARIDPASLPDRDPRELRELLFAYGRLGGSEAAETLIRFAHKAPLLKSRRWAPVRAAAAWALGASAEPRARAELEILARDGATEVSQAARSALALRNRGSAPQSGHNDPDEDDEP